MSRSFFRRVSIVCLSLSTLLLSSAFAQATESSGNAASNPIVSIEAGWNSQFLVYADGRAAAWGANKDSQLGDGTYYEQYVPKWLSLATVKQAASSMRASYVLLQDGTVWRSGTYMDNVKHVLVTDPPTRIEGLASISAISAGNDSLIALKNDGTVWTLGNDLQGANRASQDSKVPVQVSGLQNIKAVSAGGYHFMALGRDGQVWTWGYNYYGAIGNGTKDTQFEPYLVTGIGKVKSIAAGNYDSNALLEDGSVWNWGRTIGLTSIRKIPAKLNALKATVAISAGGQLLALQADGTVNTVEGKVAGLSHVIRINAGYTLNLAQTKDGAIYSWGYGGYPGDGTQYWVDAKLSKVKMPLRFSVNGEPANVKLSPMYRDGMLYISRSELFQSLGVKVDIRFSDPDPKKYNAVYETWTFSKSDRLISYSLHDQGYRIGDELIADAPKPFSVNGNYSNTTMFPLRYLCEKLGISVALDAATNTVMLRES
ncbi:stalk domain-containing protein [Cohnella sp. GCM10012308]|uniref:stalk domain-containing protein n=1 Tax=Cohnella sp. GCM10012308 TaxID=3317329 RepID=UPI003607668E